MYQITDQNDLYIKAWVQGEDPQETDTHWRCKKGKVGIVAARPHLAPAHAACTTSGLVQLAHEV